MIFASLDVIPSCRPHRDTPWVSLSYTPRKTNMSPENQWLEMVGRCISYWNSPVLGDMLVFGCVVAICDLLVLPIEQHPKTNSSMASVPIHLGSKETAPPKNHHKSWKSQRFIFRFKVLESGDTYVSRVLLGFCPANFDPGVLPNRWFFFWGTWSMRLKIQWWYQHLGRNASKRLLIFAVCLRWFFFTFHHG